MLSGVAAARLVQAVLAVAVIAVVGRAAAAAAVPARRRHRRARIVHGRDAARRRSARASSRPTPACRWRSAPSSPACCWPRPSIAAPSRRRSSRSRACCSACSSSRSACSIDLALIWREPLLVAGGCRRPDRASRPCCSSRPGRLFGVPWAAGVRDRPAAGAGRRVRLRRSSACRSRPAWSRARGGGVLAVVVAHHGADPAARRLPAGALGHRLRARQAADRRHACCRPTTSQARHRRRPRPGRPAGRRHARPHKSPTSPSTATPAPVARWRARGRPPSTSATPPTGCSWSAAASTRRRALIVTIDTRGGRRVVRPRARGGPT